MAVRRILEKLIESTGSSGYGFTFSLKHLNFYLACKEVRNGLAGVSRKIVLEKAKGYMKSIMDSVVAITDNASIRATGRNLGLVNAIFQSMRRALMVPRNGKLLDDLTDDNSIHDRRSLTVEHMGAFPHAGIPNHIRTATKIIMERCRKRETILFVNSP